MTIRFIAGFATTAGLIFFYRKRPILLEKRVEKIYLDHLQPIPKEPESKIEPNEKQVEHLQAESDSPTSEDINSMIRTLSCATVAITAWNMFDDLSVLQRIGTAALSSLFTYILISKANTTGSK